ncbi:hypothetical protein PHAVU_001G246900 [Phaseolus vulgaris]|uniref:Uncharacterized protein n=1 Tax=Phaseolus vulgaris TaxID=3885 RepID=V7D2W8_PHAVU|nr:hypothetical protein PHAVU_001G246900g [Phaseolus vulgaris]ESW35581.1 hypothetical protein PHAVU_001G246900g [Phaseolus vulgaris]
MHPNKRESYKFASFMAYTFPDVFCWIQKLPPISEWETNSISLNICSSSSCQPSLTLTITKNHHSSKLYFVISADCNTPIHLWASKPFKHAKSKTAMLIDDETISNFFVNFNQAILLYGSNKNAPLLRFPKLVSTPNLSDVFNLSFFTLLFLVCIYEAPAADFRSRCISNLKDHLTGFESRKASNILMKLLGSNVEELWMRSVNLAVTNWVGEQEAHSNPFKTPCPLFSYAFSASGLWKVQLYCPLIVMDVENSKSNPASERLQFSLKYHHVEAVLQFNHKVLIKKEWVEIMVDIDNIRCDVIKLVNESLMKERGADAGEKHFPSRICLQLTPIVQNQVLSLSVGKSSENPRKEFGVDKSVEASFEPSSIPVGLRVSAGESTTVSLKPWKFEESVYGYSANLNWFLHDSVDGKEVFSSKPSKCAMINPKSWFKNRYSSALRPFTRQGGVIFAGDEYGEKVWWKVDKEAIGKTIEIEIRGWIWLTYWPNKRITFHTETRRLEFREIVYVHVV